MRYIVSLTSFSGRIHNIWITLETILRQSFKPDQIILWLGEDQFENIELPENLLGLKSRGLTINFCKDVRSHTKYYYTIQLFPDANIITLDDDCYYPSNTIEQLVKLHKQFPSEICSNRVHKILTKNGSILPYMKWKHNYKKNLTPNHNLLQTGVSGVLYPPKSLHKDVLDQAVFKELCFYADDLWLKLHAIRNGTKVVTSKNFNKDLICVSDTQNNQLVSKNSFGGRNDSQFNDISKFYNLQLEILIIL